MSAIEYWLWLSTAENVGCRAKALLLERYGDAEAAFFAPDGELGQTEGISRAEAAVLERRDKSGVSQVLEECDRQQIRIVTMQDAAYPKRLKNIYAPPVVLYVKGNLPAIDEEPVVSVIGTRRPSPYGLKMGRDMAYQIAACGGTVVSLLTAGIDAEAARGTLLAGGRCIGILGTPHELSGGRLAEDVCASGGLISEYAPGMTPFKSFFRERNRIASGISLGVVVVEAPEKSGTRLFAAEAAEQGKEIFALPGNADAENSAGTIALLKEGAKLVTRGAEVMSEFEGRYPGRVKLRVSACPPEEKREEERPAAVSVKKDVDKEKRKGYIDLKEQLASLSEDQLKIITAIDKNASHIDDIIEATGLPTAKVLAQLTVLEIKGFVRREAGRRISLNTAKK